METTKLVTFSPSTESALMKEMSESADNLNQPLPPEMSTLLKSDSVASPSIKVLVFLS